MINEGKKRPPSLFEHLPPARLSNAAVERPSKWARDLELAERQSAERAGLAQLRREGAAKAASIKRNEPVTSRNEPVTTGNKPVTLAKPPGKRGPAATYASAAEKQRAYRARRAQKA